MKNVNGFVDQIAMTAIGPFLLRRFINPFNYEGFKPLFVEFLFKLYDQFS
jgi:hypothetical protein